MKGKLCVLLIVILLISIIALGCGKSSKLEKKTTTEKITTSNNENHIIVGETEIISTTHTQEETQTIDEQENTTTKQEEITTEKKVYTYSDINKTMYAKSSVNVRKLPSTEGEKIGGLSKGQQVLVTGQCKETNWYRITYKEQVAFVSNNYLVEDMPVEETTQSVEASKDKFVEFHNSFGCAAYGSCNSESGVQRYCVHIYDVHYEVTEEIDKLIGKCTTQKVKEWSELISGYYKDDDTVVLLCGFAVEVMSAEEFKSSGFNESALVYESYDAMIEAQYKFIEQPRYEMLMQYGYIQIISYDK